MLSQCYTVIHTTKTSSNKTRPPNRPDSGIGLFDSSLLAHSSRPPPRSSRTSGASPPTWRPTSPTTTAPPPTGPRSRGRTRRRLGAGHGGVGSVEGLVEGMKGANGWYDQLDEEVRVNLLIWVRWSVWLLLGSTEMKRTYCNPSWSLPWFLSSPIENRYDLMQIVLSQSSYRGNRLVVLGTIDQRTSAEITISCWAEIDCRKPGSTRNTLDIPYPWLNQYGHSRAHLNLVQNIRCPDDFYVLRWAHLFRNPSKVSGPHRKGGAVRAEKKPGSVLIWKA